MIAMKKTIGKVWIGWVNEKEIEEDFNTMMRWTKILRKNKSKKYGQLLKVRFVMEAL